MNEWIVQMKHNCLDIQQKILNKKRVSIDFPDLRKGNDNIIKLLKKQLWKQRYEIIRQYLFVGKIGD